MHLGCETKLQAQSLHLFVYHPGACYCRCLGTESPRGSLFSGSMKNSVHIGTCLFTGTAECNRDSVSADLPLIRLFARQKKQSSDGDGRPISWTVNVMFFNVFPFPLPPLLFKMQTSSTRHTRQALD